MVEAPLILIFFPLVVVWLIWMIFFLANDPSEEVREVKRYRFLGPGGPDDPFAGDPWDEDEADQPPTPVLDDEAKEASSNKADVS